jgi:succinate dehydrogenase / fumarate reductase membrane anchor subunit
MVKSVLATSHQGLRDWLVQRITAVIMTIYSIGMIVYFILNPHPQYIDWHMLFSYFWMKIATLIFLGCMLYHAWVGLWTVFTDYVKCYWFRLVLHTGVLLALIAFFFAGFAILWGI